MLKPMTGLMGFLLLLCSTSAEAKNRDAAVTLTGVDSSCEVYCLKSERIADDTLLLFAIANGRIEKTVLVDIPANARVESVTSQVSGSDNSRHAAGYSTQSIPDNPTPPPGGNGSVVLSVTYVTNTHIVVITVTYFWVNGELVDVQTDERRAPIRPTQPR